MYIIMLYAVRILYALFTGVDVCAVQMLMEEEAKRHHHMLSTECVSEHNSQR